MPALLLYLLKVNVALLLFFLAYHLVLCRLTFYHLNRRFLLFGILFATLYPFLDITSFLDRHQELSVVYITTIPALATATTTIAATPAFDFWQIPMFLFWLGTGVMVLRLVLQFVSLYRIHAASEPGSHNSIDFRQVRSITQAFSFWQNIYLNPDQHKQEELESILRHELVHVKGWHTLDVLLAEISTVFYWFNPGAWLMKRAIKENLEFIADQNVVRTGVDRKAYQYLLLKTTAATEPQLALSFSFPSLKRRIAMMNKMPTKKANQLRLLVVLPIVAVLLLAFRSATEPAVEFAQQNEPAVETTAAALPTPQQVEQQEERAIPEALPQDDLVYVPDPANQTADYKDFLRRNPQVKQVGWKGSQKTVLVIFLNSGETELYNLLDEKSRTAAEQKYGKLPGLVPPPPPAAPPAPPAPPAPAAPPAPPVPGSAKLIESEKKVIYIFNPYQFTEDEFIAAQKLFAKHGCQLKFNNQYKGKELTHLKLSVNHERGKLTGDYSVQELKDANEFLVLEIDKALKMAGISPQPFAQPASPAKNKEPRMHNAVPFLKDTTTVSKRSLEAFKARANSFGVIYLDFEDKKLLDNTKRFEGGKKELSEYLAKNVKYPRVAINEGAQGNAEVEFTSRERWENYEC